MAQPLLFEDPHGQVVAVDEGDVVEVSAAVTLVSELGERHGGHASAGGRVAEEATVAGAGQAGGGAVRVREVAVTASLRTEGLVKG
jgi:hypothetical protein